MGKLAVPSFWETLLKRYVKKTFYVGTRREPFADRGGFTEGDYRFFATGVRKLNIAFTRERGSLPKNYFNQKDLRSGYLLYFLPVNALKVVGLLSGAGGGGGATGGGPPPPRSEASSAGGYGSDRTPSLLTILDIGSGPGTGLFGTFQYLMALGRPLRLRWVLVDRNREALRDAENLHQGLLDRFKESVPLESALETHRIDLPEDLRKIGPIKADLILALNCLGEIPSSGRLHVVETLLERHLKETGRMLVMEPALQRTTRELMELHDVLLSRKSAVVFGPCLHQAACPMLAGNRRDWCHTYLEWERPAWIEKFDRLAAIRKDYLKCSYLLLGVPREERVLPRVPPAGAHFIAPPSGARPESPAPIWRVVSGHLNSKGKSELLLCGPGGLPDLLRVTRLDRDRSDRNRAFDEVGRGNLLQMAATRRILKTTTLSKIRS